MYPKIAGKNIFVLPKHIYDENLPCKDFTIFIVYVVNSPPLYLVMRGKKQENIDQYPHSRLSLHYYSYHSARKMWLASLFIVVSMLLMFTIRNYVLHKYTAHSTTWCSRYCSFYVHVRQCSITCDATIEYGGKLSIVSVLHKICFKHHFNDTAVSTMSTETHSHKCTYCNDGTSAPPRHQEGAHDTALSHCAWKNSAVFHWIQPRGLNSFTPYY